MTSPIGIFAFMVKLLVQYAWPDRNGFVRKISAPGEVSPLQRYLASLQPTKRLTFSRVFMQVLRE